MSTETPEFQRRAAVERPSSSSLESGLLIKNLPGRMASDAAPQMSIEETYHFDLTGYLVVKDVLSQKELRTANELIDQQVLTASPSYAGDSKAMRGDGTGVTRLDGGHLLELPPVDGCQPFWNMLA